MTTDSIIPEADSAHAKQEVPHAQFARQYCADHNLPHDYYSVSRPEKSAILDAAQHATGYHRKSLIRLFRRLIALAREAVLGITRKVKKVGRPAKYLPESGDVVRSLAERMGVSERKIAGAIPRWIPVAAKLAPAHLRDRVVQDLRSMSSATFGRLLRKDGATRSHSPRKPRPRSRHQLATPLRTWDDWADVRPGEMQVDSVAHAGGRGGGGHAWTVTVIDVFSGWTDAEAIAKLTKENVAAALDRMKGRTPFAWSSVHTDNGVEFLNDAVITWCDENRIAQTRGRPGKSNDQAHVENANKTFVRGSAGEQRYEGTRARDVLNALYAVRRSLANFFEARQRLVEKRRNGRRITRRYDAAQMPDVRLVESGYLTESEQRALDEMLDELDLEELLAAQEKLLDRLWEVAKATR